MASTDIALHEHESIHLSEDGVGHDLFTMEAPENAQPAMLPVSRQRQFSILICAFFDVFITIGMNQAYGVFLTYYLDPVNNEREAFLAPEQLSNKALVAFVGTLGAGLTWAGSIFVNPLMTRVKDPRKLTLVGAALIGLGYVLASFSHNVGCPPCLSYRYAVGLTGARYGSYC
jgi:MFS family permease